MIIPFASPVAIFLVGMTIEKGTFSGIHMPGCHIGFTTPICLQPNDKVWVDVRSGILHTIERGGIAIWRKDWVN